MMSSPTPSSTRTIRNSQNIPLAEIIPNFAAEVLELDDPITLISTLHDFYETRRKGDAIVPGEPQWIHGSHENLQYRGNNLRRMKMWFQTGPTEESIEVYSYTGFQYGVLQAQFDVSKSPLLERLLSKYNKWATTVRNRPEANHGIVTQYENRRDNIGMHFDKPSSLDSESLITIVKLGPGSRPFRIEDLDGNVLFHEVLHPGTAVVMTMEQNLATKHGVPECESVQESSGSIVFRTVVREEPVKKVVKRAKKTKENREAKKLKRAQMTNGEA